jgi:hypothetical protein
MSRPDRRDLADRQLATSRIEEGLNGIEAVVRRRGR